MRWLTVMLMLAASAARAGEYSRTAFGDGWLDLDGDGRDAREEALNAARQSIDWWWGRYTGQPVFDASRLDVDHVVPLAWAWERGAREWPAERRERFANDPANLLPVIAGANRSKGSRGPDEWMPANVAAWSDYLDRFEAVVAKYGLGVSEAERETFACLRRLAERHAIGIKVAGFVSCGG
ncbi:MAG: HNH endonuclease family protein [Gammaproteobacteria bacterium]|nr:HNH endonuclease family protein [Gammaproteobacteria bacterium]